MSVLFLCLTLCLTSACGGGGQDPVKQLDGLVTMVESKSGSMTEAQLQQSVGITTGGFDDSGANLNFAVDIHVKDKYII